MIYGCRKFMFMSKTENTVRITCNQNNLFGCGRIAEYPAIRYTIGIDRRRIQAGGRCACGLPLAIVRDDYQR